MGKRFSLAWLNDLVSVLGQPAAPIMAAAVVVLATACAYLPEWLGGDEDEPSVPPASACRLATCWDGAGASVRYMNSLSPHFTEDRFRDYLQRQKARGATTTHQIICNRGDGQGAPYNIYTKTSTWDWTVDPAIVATMKARIQAYRDEGFAVVIWLLTDDSGPWAREIERDFQRYLNDVEASGLLDQASIVVVGLELGEYYRLASRAGFFGAVMAGVGDLYQSARVAAFVQATRNVYSGAIGTHENSGEYKYAKYGDICFYQVEPGHDAKWIENEARRVKAALGGKPWNFFELDRKPNRALCEAAFRGDPDLAGVGNW